MTTQNQVSLTIINEKSFQLRKRLVQMIKQAFAQKKKETDAQRSYREMAQLPDYILKDLGVTRAEINLKLNKPWWWS